MKHSDDITGGYTADLGHEGVRQGAFLLNSHNTIADGGLGRSGVAGFRNPISVFFSGSRQ
jgi:hypothetical protein